MDKLNRLFKLHNLFRNRKQPVSLSRIREELGCSERTARRDIARSHERARIETRASRLAVIRQVG